MGGGEITHRLLFTLPTAQIENVKNSISHFESKWPGIEVTYLPLQRGQQISDQSIYHDKTVIVTLWHLPGSTKDCPKLRLVHLWSAGYDSVQNQPFFRESKVPITTSSGVHGPQIAEWVLMTTLVQSHHYDAIYEQQKRHRWGGWAKSRPVHDLVGQRIGILGYGSIGRQVARMYKNAGSDIIAFTATPKDDAGERRDQGYVVPGTGDPRGEFPSAWYSGLDKKSLHNFLSQDIDILVLSLPLSPQTQHMLSTEEFRLLAKKKALVVNISRGPIIDQVALLKALKNGELRGANLDVTDPEPLPEDNELWDLPNVIVSPHISGSSASYAQRLLAILDINLGRLDSGKPLINVIGHRT